MEIHHDIEGAKGRYWIQSGDGPVAELTYSNAGESLRIIDHTGVPDAYRGHGVGVALVGRAVADARREGVSILPLCPFAAAQMRRHPEWQDVLQKKEPKS